MSENKTSAGAITVIHGANDGTFDICGEMVATVRLSLANAFNIPSDAISFANGLQVGPTYKLMSNDTLEFVKLLGEKSVLDPEEKAQLDRIELMLKRMGAEPDAFEVKLNEAERRILRVLGNDKMDADTLAEKTGYSFNSSFRSKLASLVRRGLIVNARPGYHKSRSGLSQD